MRFNSAIHRQNSIVVHYTFFARFEHCRADFFAINFLASRFEDDTGRGLVINPKIGVLGDDLKGSIIPEGFLYQCKNSRF